ncbi:MAG: 4-(cytidine 5'-diphospho)-2-C-methyl-D-erythritol kinase [Rhizobiales bacterium]|jgi:4-diphosphocytidyl-2-C-methyl-D-erythritol kinase|nr:4-(cytidine 5'-diphospho)-2-C-methyl-D-erythritol kinase [Hyphomicrobiales bacterium]
MTPLVEHAPAKVNLSLNILGRRADGYHALDSLVVFAGAGDRLTFAPGRPLSLHVSGATAEQAGPIEDNLVIKAARGLADAIAGLRLGHFTLDKRLPVAAGLGGGSSDAAAALRLLARANRLALDDARLRRVARRTGADVPVCLDPRPRRMRGIGEVLSAPLSFQPLAAVLINPGVAVPTKDVFAILGLKPEDGIRRAARPRALPPERGALIAALAAERNDLEPAAITLQPVIAKVLAALRKQQGCDFARMSGSGATCFGLFTSARAASVAARGLAARYPRWWVKATTFG